MRPPHSPLTDAHLEQIKRAQEAIAAAETQLILAKQAGIDVNAIEKELADSTAKIRALRNTYFPGE